MLSLKRLPPPLSPFCIGSALVIPRVLPLSLLARAHPSPPPSPAFRGPLLPLNHGRLLRLLWLALASFFWVFVLFLGWAKLTPSDRRCFFWRSFIGWMLLTLRCVFSLPPTSPASQVIPPRDSFSRSWASFMPVPPFRGHFPTASDSVRSLNGRGPFFPPSQSPGFLMVTEREVVSTSVESFRNRPSSLRASSVLAQHQPFKAKVSADLFFRSPFLIPELSSLG